MFCLGRDSSDEACSSLMYIAGSSVLLFFWVRVAFRELLVAISMQQLAYLALCSDVLGTG